MLLKALHGLFGASVDDVLEYLPGAGYADVATVRRAVAAGSTTTLLNVDSTAGLVAGSWVHVPLAGGGEVREIDEVVSDTSFSLVEALPVEPASGLYVDNGPECIRRELVRAESFVVSKLPERYRRMLNRVTGELIVSRAQEGQTTAALALAPGVDVQLYKNFTGMLEELSRYPQMPADSWSLEEQAVTFAASLAAGDMVLACYDVGDPHLQILQTLLVDLATYRVGRRLVGQFAQATPEWLVSFRDRGESTLEEIFSTGRGVAELDAVRLYEDWERPNRGLRFGVVERS